MTVTKANIGDLLVSYRCANMMMDAHIRDWLETKNDLNLQASEDYANEMREIEEAIKAALPDVDSPDGSGQ